MRATRWSVLVAAGTLLGACSSGSVQLVSPEPPPATEVQGPAPVPPEAGAPVDDVAVPAAPAEAQAPTAAPAAPGAEGAAAAEDDPVPEGVGRTAAVTSAAAGPGAVQAASARPSGRPQPTGRIEIPAIGLDHQTYEGIDLATINYGPGHWPGTPLPGQQGNTVFPGHRTTYSRPFWDIDKLRPGNDVIFTTPAGRFTYEVTQTMVVGARETRVVHNTPDATFTIMACHPKGSARQRFVVKGRLVSAPPPPPPATTAPPTTQQKILGLL